MTIRHLIKAVDATEAQAKADAVATRLEGTVLSLTMREAPVYNFVAVVEFPDPPEEE